MILKTSAAPVPANMMACPDCKTVISKQAAACPKCGRSFRPSASLVVVRVIVWLIILGGVGAIVQRLADN